MRAKGLQRIRGAPREEHAEVLQVLSGLPRGRLPPPPRQASVRLQRVREGARVPAEEEVLHRLRRAGAVRVRAQPVAHRRPPGRGDRQEDGRGPLALHQERAVPDGREGGQPRPLRQVREKHGLRLDRERAVQGEDIEIYCPQQICNGRFGEVIFESLLCRLQSRIERQVNRLPDRAILVRVRVKVENFAFLFAFVHRPVNIAQGNLGCLLGKVRTADSCGSFYEPGLLQLQ